MIDICQAIRPGEIYTAEETQRRLGITNWQWRDIKKRIPWTRIGRTKLVKSDVVLAMVASLMEEQEAETA